MAPKSILFIFILTLILISCTKDFSKNDNVNWAEYQGGLDRNQYSSLTQITPENVADLEIAWTYSTIDSGQMQVNPLIVDGVLYGVTPTVQAFALDAETGEEIWKYGDTSKVRFNINRGVSYWTDGEEARIFHAIGSNLYCLDAETGIPIPTFGDSGTIHLNKGLPEIAKNKYISSNTPGTIFEDLIVLSLRLSEGADAAPGDIRAFNVKTGELAWTFHTIPYPGEEGYETFPPDAYKNIGIGAANNWAGMSVDKDREIIYVPTGSAAFDFYGGNRIGQNFYANSLLALNVRTGKRIWHFQTTHHDIWDRDLPAPPNLITVRKNGKRIDAVAQISKQGYVYVFNRETGEPLFPIEEVKVPKSNLDGEVAWETQPIPTKPAPYARQNYELNEKDVSIFAENREELLVRFRNYDRRHYAPPSLEGTLIFPGFDGGGEWGGAAADPDKGILYVNSNEMPWVLTMVPSPDKKEIQSLTIGERIYSTSCSTCHGNDRKGNPLSNYPSLVDIDKKMNRTSILNIISEGKGMMPGLTTLSSDEKQAVIDYVLGMEKEGIASYVVESKAPFEPYKSTGYNKFLDSNGHPAISPPWGTLNAIDLNSGEYLWRIPLGEEPNLEQKGTGTENYGGPVVTASGLLFIAATKDEKFRAFDKLNGKLLWETELPASSFATPSTYQVNGKQYVVVACGGTKLGTKKGNQYVAFTLPEGN